MEKQKVVVAMSGGVDSSVAAALLVEQGYEVIGVFMQFWFPKGIKYGENACCSLESYNQAREVADILGINLYKMNVGRQFKKLIVDEFLAQYQSGKTPNPCISCNKFIKFDLLLKNARTMFDADYLATGHYVRLRREFPIYNLQFSNKSQKSKSKNQKIELLRGKDKNKDQSYFLYNLNQKNLKYLMFPVGEYTKPQVRKLARRYKLPIYDKADSQEICFVGSSHYDFLKKYLKLKRGEIVDEKGKVLGEHQGLPLYTMGQRSGIGLAGGPWYVSGFDRQKNRLIVTRDQKSSGIYQKALRADKINWVGDKPKFPLKCQAQVRYRSNAKSCTVRQNKNHLEVEFDKRERAIMPGQSVVFYENEKVLGGGVII